MGNGTLKLVLCGSKDFLEFIACAWYEIFQNDRPTDRPTTTVVNVIAMKFLLNGV